MDEAGGISLLIVDDDPDIREVLTLILEKAILPSAFGASERQISTILLAEDGIEARAKFKENNPDVVLMDILMPRCDGIQATKAILKENPAAIVIGLSAYAQMEGARMRDAGAVTVITKPFNNQQLVSTIAHFLKEGASRDPSLSSS